MNNETEFENQAEESVKPMECEPKTVIVIGEPKSTFQQIADEVAEQKKLAALYPLDWKTMDVALADGRYVHTISRPDSELILDREKELNQDIEIDKKGGYALPNPTETEEIDARFYERLNPQASGYVGAIPELHKATVLQSTLERNIYVAEGCDVYGDEIVVIEEVGNGDEPDFVIEHVLRGASESEVKTFRRKNNNRKIERARNGRQKLVQSSQLRPAMDFYQSLFVRMDGVKVADQPYSDERRADFIAHTNPLTQRAVVKAYIEELTGNLLD